MSVWTSIRDAIVSGRKDDEALHAEAMREIESGVRRPGLWAKALTRAGNNEEQAKAEYIKLVVKDLRDQRYVNERIQKEYKDQAKISQKQLRLEEEERKRDLEERERADQLEFITEQKRRASNWGILIGFFTFFVDVALLVIGYTNEAPGFYGLPQSMQRLLDVSLVFFLPFLTGFLAYFIASTVKLSGEWRPDHENEGSNWFWAFFWIIVIIALAQLSNNS